MKEIESVNVRSLLNKELGTTLKNFISVESDKSYYEFYAGKVINNNDPKKLGRCQIRVYGIYEDTILDNDLPWAIPEFQFIGSEVGSFIVPPKDALVNVRFSMGNVYEPIYITKLLNINKLPTNKNVNYPDNMIFFETDNGDYFQINRLTKEVEFKTSSGVIINIDASGNVSIEKAASFEIKHDTIATVTPNATGGPFCALQFDPLTGSPHQGTIVTNTNIPTTSLL